MSSEISWFSFSNIFVKKFCGSDNIQWFLNKLKVPYKKIIWDKIIFFIFFCNTLFSIMITHSCSYKIFGWQHLKISCTLLSCTSVVHTKPNYSSWNMSQVQQFIMWILKVLRNREFIHFTRKHILYTIINIIYNIYKISINL